MKKTLLLFALIAIVSCGETKEKEISQKETTTEHRETETKATLYDEVYVCTGKYAKRFHCDEYCRGLQSCRSEIVVMSIEEAEDHGLTPCGYCY